MSARTLSYTSAHWVFVACFPPFLLGTRLLDSHLLDFKWFSGVLIRSWAATNVHTCNFWKTTNNMLLLDTHTPQVRRFSNLKVAVWFLILGNSCSGEGKELNWVTNDLGICFFPCLICLKHLAHRQVLVHCLFLLFLYCYNRQEELEVQNVQQVPPVHQYITLSEPASSNDICTTGIRSFRIVTFYSCGPNIKWRYPKRREQAIE